MADTSWAERRNRMVKCKIHGLHYDPEMSTGCTLCLRDAAKAQPSRPPQLVVILLCILGMAFILFYIFGPNSEDRSTIDLGIASAPTQSIQKLDAEPHREQIESLENALFRIPLDETGDLLTVSEAISSAADSLSGSILSLEPAIGQNAADLIARMGQGVPADQVRMTDVQKARSQWLRIRKQQLQSAEWFYNPSSAGGSDVTTTAADYSEIAADLGSLIEDASAEAQALGEEGVELDTTTSADDAWREFTRDWASDIDRLESRLPARPGSRASAGLLAAIQDLERAIGLARALASETRAPSGSDTRFDEAINAALNAQQGFDDAAP